MAGRRFFLLDETCSAAEVPSMMGRVVADKRLPLTRFAPLEPLPSSTEPRHNPEDIVPSILPAPSLSTNRKDFLETVHGPEMKIALSSLFGLEFTHTTEERLRLQSQSVRRYALKNPDQLFKALMENELYARDVRDLLEQERHAYLVVGFMTTTGAVWSRGGRQSTREAVNVSIPVTELAGVPMPQLDPSLKVAQKASAESHSTMHVALEEVFAVAYCPVKVAYSFDKTAPKYTKKRPYIGQPKRAKPKHLAFNAESDEELDDEDAEGLQPLVLDDAAESEDSMSFSSP